MIEVNPILSGTTLSVNKVNTLIKRQSLEEWIQKHDPTIDWLQETCFRFKDTNRLNRKEPCANNNQKRVK